MGKLVEEGTIEYVINQVIQGAKKPRLLLHACCGPCASSVLEFLHNYFDITVYFYNPNILPKEEFMLRLDALKVVVSQYNDVKLIVPDYNQNDYIPYVKGMENLPEGGARCSICFNIRLSATAQFLKDNFDCYDYFATTLTVSPHKNDKLINQIGQNIATKYGVNYLSSNLKKKDGYLRSTQISKELGIYRQNYCGCKFD